MDGELEGVEAVRVICRRKGGREEVRVVFVLFLQLVTPPFFDSSSFFSHQELDALDDKLGKHHHGLGEKQEGEKQQ